MMQSFDIDVDLEHANASDIRDEFDQSHDDTGRKRISCCGNCNSYRSPSGQRRRDVQVTYSWCQRFLLLAVVILLIVLSVLYYSSNEQQQQQQQQQGAENPTTGENPPLPENSTPTSFDYNEDNDYDGQLSSSSSSSQTTSSISSLQLLQLFSPAFDDQGEIPVKYGRKDPGSNVSPPLEWEWHNDVEDDSDIIDTRTTPPPESMIQSYALIMDDPDAPSAEPWVHWVIYNLPSNQTSLEEGIEDNNIPDGAVMGINSWNKNQYDGPQPPSGTHRYQFHIYALTTTISVDTDPLSKNELLQKIQDDIYTETILMGTFSF